MSYTEILQEYLASLDKPDWHERYTFFAQRLSTLAPPNAYEIQLRLYAKRIGVVFEDLTR